MSSFHSRMLLQATLSLSLVVSSKSDWRENDNVSQRADSREEVVRLSERSHLSIVKRKK